MYIHNLINLFLILKQLLSKFMGDNNSTQPNLSNHEE